MTAIDLPDATGRLSPYRLTGTPLPVAPPSRPFDRVAFSAAHVVADPFSPREPGEGPAIDWERTIAYRRHLVGLGLGLAEAMDTAQRGMGLDWPTALELVRRTVAGTRDLPGARIVSGCGTDHLPAGAGADLAAVTDAYLVQMEALQAAGSRLVLMASRALVRAARGPEDYARVYGRVLAQADEPVILHWLGPMFDPALAGYFGSDSVEDAEATALAIMAENHAKVDGIKISLLDKGREIAMRRRLPAGIRLYTGDDFDYPELIAGDGEHHSDALLGIFDAIAPAASAALEALAAGDRARYDALLGPTVPLSRLIFRAPTRFYKTGIVFLAYLNAHQAHPIMVDGQHAMRPLPYFCDLFRLADAAGLLADPDDAVARMRRVLALYGL